MSSFDGVRHKLSDSELLEQVHVLLLKIGDEYCTSSGTHKDYTEIVQILDIYTIRLRDQATHFDRIDMLSHLRLESGTPRDEAALYRYCEDNIARLVTSLCSMNSHLAQTLFQRMGYRAPLFIGVLRAPMPPLNPTISATIGANAPSSKHG